MLEYDDNFDKLFNALEPKTDITKFNQQYPNLKIKYSNLFHDRFLIIDNTLYHIGASLKDLGKKCFGINKIEDKEILDKIVEKIS